jgi:hypothetical protein
MGSSCNTAGKVSNTIAFINKLTNSIIQLWQLEFVGDVYKPTGSKFSELTLFLKKYLIFFLCSTSVLYKVLVLIHSCSLY